MTMKDNIVVKLTAKDDKYACAFADKIISESKETDEWYEYFDDFSSLLNHPKSLVRNRVIYILAANAQWDEENRFDSIIAEYLTHITDEKPITARQCIKALVQVGVAKPKYIPEILSYLRNADLSKYKDSMRPLIENDIAETEKKLSTLNFVGGDILDLKEITKEFYEVVVTNNQWDRIGDYIDADSVVRIGNEIFPLGIKGMKEHLIATKQTYPDYSMRITKQYQDGEYVISEFIMTGTHQGEWLGITPSNKVISITGVDIDKVVGGKIVEHGGAANTFDALWKNQLIKPV